MRIGWMALMLCVCLLVGRAAVTRAEGVLILPDSVREIAPEAFYGHQGVKEIRLPEGVERIGARAFAQSGLTRVNLPESVTQIEPDAFEGLHLASVQVAAGSYAEAYCAAQGIAYQYAPLLESAHPYADGTDQVWTWLGDVDTLWMEVTFSPQTRLADDQDALYVVSAQGQWRFAGAELAGRTIAVPGNGFAVRLISDASGAQYGFAITDVVQQKAARVKLSISGEASPAVGQPMQVHLTALGVAEPTYAVKVSRDGAVVDAFTTREEDIAYTPTASGLYRVAIKLLDAQGKAVDETAFTTSVTRLAFRYAVLPDGECAITGAVEPAGALEWPSIIYNRAVTQIGAHAFERCAALQGALHLPDGITAIGASAFAGCAGLTGDLRLPEGLTAIADRAFKGCGLTGGLCLPRGLAQLGAEAFADCAGLTGDLVLPEGLTAIGASAFAGCGFTGRLALPSGVTAVGDGAFCGCGLTGRLSLPDSLTTIGEEAFAACRFTGALTLPANLTHVGRGAFRDAGFTGALTLPDGLTVISADAFSGNRFSGALALPDGLTAIEAGAFAGCDGLTGVYLPPSVQLIAEDALPRAVSARLPLYGEADSSAQAFAQTHAEVYDFIPTALHALTVSGTVCTREGAPLAGVFVSLYADQALTEPLGSAFTDAAGAWAWRGADAASSVYLDFALPGYTFAARGTRVDIGHADARTPTAFALPDALPASALWLSAERWTPTAAAALQTVRVQAGSGWQLVSAPDWVTVYAQDGSEIAAGVGEWFSETMTVGVGTNSTGEPRTGEVCLSSGAQRVTFTVAQTAEDAPEEQSAEGEAQDASDDGGRSPSEAYIAFAKRLEGFSATRRADAAGKTVIGYGHRIDAQRETLDEPLTEEAADALLRAELAAHAQAVHAFAKAYGVALTQQQFDALVDLCYDAGAGWMTQSALGRTLRAHPDAATIPAQDICAGFAALHGASAQTKLADIRRRLEEIELFLYGDTTCDAHSAPDWLDLSAAGSDAVRAGWCAEWLAGRAARGADVLYLASPRVELSCVAQTACAASVTASAEWTAASDADWLVPARARYTPGEQLAFAASENPGAAREGHITLCCGAACATLTVYQHGAQHAAFQFSADGATAYFADEAVCVALQATGGAGGYGYQYALYRQGFTGVQGTLMDQPSAATLDLGQLDAGAYRLELIGTDVDGACQSASFSFTVKHRDMALLSPDASGGIVSSETPLVVRWTPVAQADAYALSIRDLTTGSLLTDAAQSADGQTALRLDVNTTLYTVEADALAALRGHVLCAAVDAYAGDIRIAQAQTLVTVEPAAEIALLAPAAGAEVSSGEMRASWQPFHDGLNETAFYQVSVVDITFASRRVLDAVRVPATAAPGCAFPVESGHAYRLEVGAFTKDGGQIGRTQATFGRKTPYVVWQKKERYQSSAYVYYLTPKGRRRTVGYAGCGLCAVVNAVYYLNGVMAPETAQDAEALSRRADADVAAVLAFARGANKGGIDHYNTENGTAATLYKAFAEQRGADYGIAWAGRYNTTLEDIRDRFLRKDGYVAIAAVYREGTEDTHMICLADYDPQTDQYLVLDSAGKSSDRWTNCGDACWAWKSIVNRGKGTGYQVQGTGNRVIILQPGQAYNVYQRAQ